MSAYLTDASRYPLLTVEEEIELAKRYRETGDKEAARKLVTSNLRFVVKIAYEYVRYGVKLADLVQEGNLGLMRAVQKFDPSRGYRFISYAVWWIRAFIQAFILKSWSLVKIGTTQAQRRLFFSLEKARREVAKIDGAVPEELGMIEADKLSTRLNASTQEIESMDLRIKGRDLSIDAHISDDSPDTYLDITPDPNSDFQEEVIRREDGVMLKDRIGKVLENLPQKERYIVENRMMADEPMTLEEIGKTFGVTRERARQIEARASKRLKEALMQFAPAV
jgi:RNA polymerase sigma-32 factor